MIKANELRIGNKVLYKPYGNRDGEPITIAGILGMKAYFSKYSNESGMLHNLEPIPLTPEILEKCGFDGTKKEGVYMLKFYRDEELHWSVVDPYIVYFAHDGKFIKYFPNVIYLHQLQNLYFSLTGEELNVNL